MAVLTNTMLQGSSAVEEGADDYQIEKSLRLNREDQATLTRTPLAPGNRRTWTLSYWWKQGKIPTVSTHSTNHHTFSDNYDIIGLMNTSEMGMFHAANGIGAKTVEKLRDASAWYHLVYVLDTSNSVAVDRCRMYCNGVRHTNATPGWGSNRYPNQHEEMQWNRNVLAYIGVYLATPSYEDCMIADAQFFDGLALSPSAFGSFDSTGVWNPKAFALPAPNTNITWSTHPGSQSGVGFDALDGEGFHNNHPATYAFNGNLSNKAGPANNGAGKGLSFVPPTAFEDVATFRFYGESVGANMRFRLHDGDNWGSYHVDNEAVWDGSNTSWRDISAFIPANRKVAKFEYESLAGGHAFIGAIEVNGVILVDGQTDNTTRNNPNNGTKWSDLVTGTAYTNQGGDKAFDGLESTLSQASNPGEASLTFKPPAAITGRVEILIAAGAHGGSVTGQFDLKIGNVSKFDNSIWPNNVTKWVDLGEQTIDTTYGLVWGNSSGGNWHGIKMIKIDGHPMLDDATDNSFHLKFNDITSTKALGYDSLSTRTIRKPGSTTDLNEDSSKASLVLAIPGDTIEDVHHTIKGSGSAKSLTNTNCTSSITTSHFYGTSTHLNGTNAKLTTTTDSSDFDISGGTFTFECWFMSGESTSTSKTIITTKETGGGTGALELGINQNKLFCYSGGNQIMTTTQSTATVSALTTDQWYHIAVTRDGTTWRWFIDGVLAHSNATSVSGSSDGCFFGYASTAGGTPSTRYLKANLQDIRFYKGAAKYTIAFKPPAPNNFTVNNLITSSSYISTPLTTTGTFEGSRGADKAFNGKVNGTDYAHAASGQTCTISFTAVTGITKLRLNIAKNSGSDNWGTIELNDTDDITSWLQSNYAGVAGTAQWIDVTSQLTGTSLSKLEFSTSGNNDIRIAGVEVNDNILIDSKEDDSFVDSPTSYGTDTGAGGEVRGNYCTLNPLQSDLTSLINGNLDYTNTGGWKEALGTIGVTSGKWYYEVECVGGDGDGNSSVGFAWKNNPGQTGAGSVDYAVMFENSGWDQNFSTSKTNRNIDVDEGDILGVSLDLDSGTPIMRTWVNNGDQNTINLGGTWSVGKALFPYVNSNNTGARWRNFNFGQRPWQKTCPSGYKALCTQNFDDTFTGANINNPSKFFDIVSYEGTGGSLTHTGLGFGPDMIWNKCRNEAPSHIIYDQVRTAGEHKGVNPDLVRPMGGCYDSGSGEYGYISAFTSDGYTVTDGTQGTDYVNQDDDTYVGFCWDAGTTASGANTNGTINIASGNQWVNNNCGFSITKYTGTGADATFGHGLSTQPQFIIIKKLAGDADWTCQHVGATLGSGRMILNENYSNDTSNADTYWNSTAPTNALISIGDHANTNGSGADHICYAWAEIPGYSSFGTYAGNGNANGPFVYTGFRPKWVLIKNTTSGGNWNLFDTARSTYNPTGHLFLPNTGDDEFTESPYNDILSNGFKLRTNDSGQSGSNANQSSDTYLYAAFAEHPFKTARAK